VKLGPVDAGSGSRLREGIGALPPSVTSLDLLPGLSAQREGGPGGAWSLQLLGHEPRTVPCVLELCAAFDRPGLPCGLVGEVRLWVSAADGAGQEEALGAYLGQCAEVAGRLRAGGSGGVGLALVLQGEDGDGAAGGAEAGGGEAGGGEATGGFLGRVLAAVLPAAAQHVRALQLLLTEPPAFPPGFSRHLASPALAFPLLEQLELGSYQFDDHYYTKMCEGDESDEAGPSMAAADVEALARLDAPRLWLLSLLSSSAASEWEDERSGGVILGGSPCGAVGALAMGRPRPVDAAGRARPGGLEILVGACAPEGEAEELERALVAAGRPWVSVSWEDEGDDDYFADLPYPLL
jgi:hypothetical protein